MGLALKCSRWNCFFVSIIFNFIINNNLVFNKKNGKIYIGQSKNNKDCYIGSGKLLLKSIKKYGKSFFLKEVLIEGEFSKDELDNFIDEYGTPDDSIDWGQVANDFDGIEFPTYDENNFRTLVVKTGQKKYMFLYTMDIASGCIWNPDGVLGLKSFGERK